MALWLMLIIILAIFLIAAIPLHFAASMLGGHSTLIKAAVTNLLVGAVGALIYFFLPIIGGIVYVIAVLLIYKSVFNIGWLRALFVWLIQGVIAFILIMIVVALGFLVI